MSNNTGEKSPVTTHILDIGKGRPAASVAVVLESSEAGSWKPIANSLTDADGRLTDWFSGPLASGVYRLRFDTGTYFSRQQLDCFYPEVVLCFRVTESTSHYHVPLLLNQWGYSTYRGS